MYVLAALLEPTNTVNIMSSHAKCTDISLLVSKLRSIVPHVCMAYSTKISLFSSDDATHTHVQVHTHSNTLQSMGKAHYIHVLHYTSPSNGNYIEVLKIIRIYTATINFAQT